MAADTTARLPFPLPAETVQEITAQAKQIKFSTLLLSVLGGLFIGLGWVAFKAFTVVGRSVVWAYAASRYGWRKAAGIPTSQPDLAAVMRENEWLRHEVERLS